jgi:diaminopimelate decarboxylase
VSEERRTRDKFPLEVREYIEAAAERGAEKAMVKLYAEIGKAGVKKAGIILLGILTAVATWLGFGGHLPK